MLPYPQSTFEALLVKTVNGRDYLKELVDALFIVEVSKLLKGLLDLLPKSLRLIGMTGAKGKKKQTEKIFQKIKTLRDNAGSVSRHRQDTGDK